MPFFVTGTKSPKVLASAFIFKHVYTQSMTYFVLLLHYLESPKMRHHLELVTMDWMIHLFLFCIYFCVNLRKTCKHACPQSCIDTCNTQTHWLKEAHTQLGTNKHTHIHTHTHTHTLTRSAIVFVHLFVFIWDIAGRKPVVCQSRWTTAVV